MASPAPSRPTPREPDRHRCRRSPTTPLPQVAHPPGEPPDSSFLSPSRWFPPFGTIAQHPTAGFRITEIDQRLTVEGDIATGIISQAARAGAGAAEQPVAARVDGVRGDRV